VSLKMGLGMAAVVVVVAPLSLGAEGEVRGKNSDESAPLFDGSYIPRVKIEVPPEGMQVLESYRQVWGQPRPERIDVKVTVQDGDLVYTNVAMHLKGSYTFEPISEKPSLTLNFDRFVDRQRFHGLDKIHLNNSVQDPSYLCEKLARETFMAAGVPTARIGHARVSLNGRDLGFYVLVEGYNKRFLKRHFSSTKGNLYDGGSGGDVNRALEVDSGENPTNRTDLTALAAAVREPNLTKRMERVEKLVDMDRFLTFAALEVLFLHWDGYCLGPNNYRLFHDVTTDKLVFLPHGLDQILGRGMSLGTSLTPKWDGLTARALFKTPEGRRRYVEHAREIYTNHFDLNRLTARVDAMMAGIQSARVLSLVERAQVLAAAEDLKVRLQRRYDAVRQQIENPPRPVSVSADEPLLITGWQLNRSSRSGATGRRHRVEDRDLLEISVSGGKWASGSWRKTLLLGPGRYEFSGLGKALNPGLNPTNGIVLRLSGDLEMPGITNATEWVTLRREFDVPGDVEEELVCEFRGPEGGGVFDLSSLRLRRVQPPR
jgi:hypothetical protein